MKRRIILAGGSGFLGGVLARALSGADTEVVVLTRFPRSSSPGFRDVAWDGESPGLWEKELEGATAVVNLAGVSVDCRYHAENRRRILDSRLKPTCAIGRAIASCARPPAVWLNASTATIYRHTLGAPWDERGELGSCPEAKDSFSVHVAMEWERVFNEAITPQTRKVALRTTMVLGQARNSVLPTLLRLGRLGLGGPLAGGRQYVSWIHVEDFARAVAWVVRDERLVGPVNIAAPHPVTNAELMAEIRRACGVPFGLPATSWMLELGAFFLSTETELVLKSRRVVPGKLLESGFEFRHPKLREAIADLVHPGAGRG